MGQEKYKDIPRRHDIKTGKSRWCELGSIMRQNIGDQQCFYCNFALECGEQECIWHEECR